MKYLREDDEILGVDDDTLLRYIYDDIGDDELAHYGVKRRSGRYPWGSGEYPFQRTGDFLSRIDELKKDGLSDTDIAKSMKLTTTQFRIQKSLANNERRELVIDSIKSLQEKGFNNTEIARKLGLKGESSVRSLLNEKSADKMKEAKNTANLLKDIVKEKGMIDVGVGVERELGISKEKLNQALYMLELEGYNIYGAGIPQVTNKGRQTNVKVLTPPDTEYKEIYNFENIKSINEYTSHDGGETFDKLVYPKSMDSKRLAIRYAEDGGSEKDGLIEIRRGVEDLSLGNSRYAQVRMLVDNDRYLKGMAVYSDDLPKGVDVLFNTNKTKDVPKRDVMKPIKDDPANPFGALIKANGQSYYIDKDGNKQLSLINKKSEEGDWREWSNYLPSQFLGKQSMELIKRQLNMSITDKMTEFDEIRSLTNPTIKKHFLQSFSDDCDAASVHLKAAALPRQQYHVILPVKSLKDTEVYAPNYKNGEKLALVRYPHGGTFEIPILTVNNKNSESKSMMGISTDAVGINSKVAARLSGADFDGDTVVAIPIGGKIKVSSTPALKGLEGFEPKSAYPYKEGMKVMTNTQKEMGVVSNLINDMTLKGADFDEIARAVRHSMVVIDAEKHKLNYRQSEKDNGIAALKKKYQGHIDESGHYREGASTLLSRAKSDASIIKRKGSPKIDPETGEQYWDRDYSTYIDKTGKVKNRMERSTQMAETRDARTLSSGTPQEEAYATYANKLKALANDARKEIISTGNLEYSASAKTIYQEQHDSLMAKLNVALKNAPKERMAQLQANSKVKALKKEYNFNKAEEKKESQRALTEARNRLGVKRENITITNKEWEAIQAGAISENKLQQILRYADADELRKRATPRNYTELSEAKQNKIKAMYNSGYTYSEIADSLGVSVGTINKYK